MKEHIWWLFAVLVIGSAASLNPGYAQEAPGNSPALEPLWNQALAQPDDFGVACMPLGDPSGAVTYQPLEAFPLISVSKLLIFIEYARRVDAGVIALDETVNVATLNRYDLPRTDTGAHERFLERYPPDVRSISLWDVAALGMIQDSSNAAADFLLERLEPVDWDSLYAMLGVTDTGYPHSLNMIPLLMNNHETGQPALLDIPSLSVEQGEALLDRYVQDLSWRQAEISYRSARRTFPTWDVQAAILDRLTVQGTVYDFLHVLIAVYDADGPLSDGIKTMVRTALQWHNNGYIDARYSEYGSKLGFYSGGVLTLIAYGQPLNGNPVISATFMRHIPRQVYNEMRRWDSIGELAHWMNVDECAGLYEVVQSLPRF
jgi:hypothetical protein